MLPAANSVLRADEPAAALEALVRTLAQDDELAPHLADGGEVPALGLLAAAGPRARAVPAEYAVLVEAIREGHLLHHARSRLLASADPDLALLAGDYLYALGLDRLAELGDLEAVAELADLISLISALRPGGDAATGDTDRVLGALWLSTTLAVAAGPTLPHLEAKRAVREGAPEAATELAAAAAAMAADNGLGEPLAHAAEAIGFPVRELPNRG